jgi:DNA-binding PadR family transcriptional regulator
MPPDPSSHLPLPAAAFHILVALSIEDQHGYAIMRDVAIRTGGEVKLHAGTLYTTMKRLLDDDLIVEVRAPRHADSDDQRRRYYRITPLGRKVAQAELSRLQSMVKRAAATLAAKG